MHRTGKYRHLNLIFGFFPFIAAVLLSRMREDSHPAVLWLSIVRVAIPISPRSKGAYAGVVRTRRSQLGSVTQLSYRPCSVSCLCVLCCFDILTGIQHPSRTARTPSPYVTTAFDVVDYELMVEHLACRGCNGRRNRIRAAFPGHRPSGRCRHLVCALPIHTDRRAAQTHSRRRRRRGTSFIPLCFFQWCLAFPLTDAPLAVVVVVVGADDQQDPTLVEARRTAPSGPATRRARLVRHRLARGLHHGRRVHPVRVHRAAPGTSAPAFLCRVKCSSH